VALNVRGIIGHNTSGIVRSGQMNYVMKFYFSSLKAAFSVTVRFVVCRSWLIKKIPFSRHVAAK